MLKVKLLANKITTLAVGSALLLTLAFLAASIVAIQNHPHSSGIINHRDAVDQAISNASDDFLDGNVVLAAKTIDKARDMALAGIQKPKCRAQLVACAMSYCGYARKDEAIAVLNDVTPYNDKTGQLARKVLAGIQRGDPGYRPRPVPDAATRARLKAFNSRMLNDPQTARHFVGQYIHK